MGGTERCFGTALEHLVAAGHDVLGAYPDGTLAEEWARIAARVQFSGSVPPTFRIKGYVGWAVRALTQTTDIRAAVHETRFDAAVVFSATATAAVDCLARAGVPTVCYVREFIEPPFVQRRLWTYIGGRADRLVAVSSALADGVEPFAAGRVRMIHDGVRQPTLEIVSQSRGTVACYSAYDPAKDAVTFVNAAIEAIRQGIAQNGRFVLFGKPNSPAQHRYARRLKALVASSDIGDAFVFDERTDFAATYSEADLVVVPSRREGLGLVALEAMAAGKAVVASDTGGLRDIVIPSVTGSLVTPCDESAFAREIGAWLADREALGVAGRAARTRVENHFSVTQSMESLERVLLELAGENAQSRRS